VKLSDTATSMALLKLGGQTAQAQQQTVALDDDEGLPVLFAARRERRTVSFTYKDRERLFDPYRLSFRNGHWYVNGFDHGHDEARTYRLDRMTKLAFASPAGAFDTASGSQASPWLPAWQMGDEPVVVARLLIDADHVELTTSFIGDEQSVDRRADGSAVVTFAVSNKEAFIGYVVGFLDHAEILEPPELRQLMVDHLQALVEA
jgi:proteasome accessory factor B